MLTISKANEDSGVRCNKRTTAMAILFISMILYSLRLLFSDYDSCGAAALCRAAAVFMKETAVELS